MLSYVSDGFYDKSYVGKWIYQVMGIELDKALEIVTNLPAQFFPETATWGLMYHEIKWGLPVRLNLPYEERRKLICQKRDYRSPMTPYYMEVYLSNITGFEVHVSDIHDIGEYGYVPVHPNIFKVTFIGEGTLDAKQAISLIKKIKQAHTLFDVEELVRNAFKIPITFENQIVFTGSFHPRPELYLNGEAGLDGVYCLDGFLDSREDLYPVVFSVYGDILQQTRHAARYRLQTETQETVYHGLQICIHGDAGKQAGSESSACISGSAKESIATGERLVIEKDLWYLDGEQMLDGSVCLDADIYEEPL